MRASDLRGFGPVGTNGQSPYAERDIMALDREGCHYMRHVAAMTKFGLHAKSDIAAELAHRDHRIAALEARLREVEKDAARHRWLRSEHDRNDPICHVVWKQNYDRGCGEWVNTSSLDREIDAAITATLEQSNG